LVVGYEAEININNKTNIIVLLKKPASVEEVSVAAKTITMGVLQTPLFSSNKVCMALMTYNAASNISTAPTVFHNNKIIQQQEP
jgi:hypothetical protein